MNLLKKKHSNITEEEIQMIMHSRKSLLFNKRGPWIRRNDDTLFDVTQGSYDGAEVCEIVGIFLLNLLQDRFGKGCVGLYRDNGLAVLPNTSGPQAEKASKDITHIFKMQELRIEVVTNLTSTDFLDVNLDLINNKYYPFRKENNEPLYINKNSNHPPSIVKQIPKMISKRLSDNSSNLHEFEKAKPAYEKALTKSGFTEGLYYQNGEEKRRKRSRKVIYFNPPYNASVKTNVGKYFLSLVLKHFPPGHKYHSLFNRNTLKLSYSCMDNIGKIIQGHNAKILSNDKQTQKDCNCRNKKSCPLDRDCQAECIVYKAEVESKKDKKKYIMGCAKVASKNDIIIMKNRSKIRIMRVRLSFRSIFGV